MKKLHPVVSWVRLWRIRHTEPKCWQRQTLTVEQWQLVARTLTQWDGWYTDPGKHHVKPTHWQHLPSPPELPSRESASAVPETPKYGK